MIAHELRDTSINYQAEEQVAILHIRGGNQEQGAIYRAAERIRRNIRHGDSVIVLGCTCAVVLPHTALPGAQLVATRIVKLLIDVEYELQIVSGPAALTLLHNLQENQEARVIQKEPLEEQALQAALRPAHDIEALPYLAFLASYPSRRLLHIFPYELACRYRCVPVGAERRVLTVATSQRLDREVISLFQQATQRTIFQVRCEAGMIEELLGYWQRTLV
ncbi:hypothetical protein [Ktedonosporobacter rubrisoli]|uniref:GspE/PulE/PilB domain-containing protein n=1 Tax=Ktedonosporobacter rubrisoli TaxID=2509675 RepID=UPI0013EED172|nr:hypothetical protein [Ktedonosporobacter rubrisoli]